MSSNYFQHQAELIAQADDAQVTIVRIKGTDCLYEWDNGTDVFRGWLRDGESLADIKWQAEPASGWTKDPGEGSSPQPRQSL